MIFAEAVDAVARTTWDSKRITMDAVVGQAALDDADIDESAALVAALSVLEAPHFRLLATLAANPPQPPPVAAPDVPEPYRSQLIAQGALALGSNSNYDAVELRISGVTGFGHKLLDWVRSSSNESLG